MRGYYLILNSRKSSVFFIDVWADSRGRLALVTTFFSMNCRVLEPGEDMSPYLCVSDSFLQLLMNCTFQVCFNVLKSACMFFWKSFFGTFGLQLVKHNRQGIAWFPKIEEETIFQLFVVYFLFFKVFVYYKSALVTCWPCGIPEKFSRFALEAPFQRPFIPHPLLPTLENTKF